MARTAANQSGGHRIADQNPVEALQAQARGQLAGPAAAEPIGGSADQGSPASVAGHQQVPLALVDQQQMISGASGQMEGHGCGQECQTSASPVPDSAGASQQPGQQAGAEQHHQQGIQPPQLPLGQG